MGSSICRFWSATPDRDLGLPSGRVDGAPLGGQTDVPPALAESARERTGPPAEHLDPDVGEELPGGARAPGLGSPEECRDGHAQAGRQRLEGDAGRPALSGRGWGGPEDGRDELPACQDRGTVPRRALWPVQGYPVERAQIGDHLGPERVQVGIADQLQEVGLLFHHNRLVPVLEEVADPVVAPIEGPPPRGVRRERMLRDSGRRPVRIRRWAWFGSRAQA